MLYDPRTTSITLFIKCFNQIADLYGMTAVLKQLPFCMREEAIEWFASLEEDITEQMAYSLAIWTAQLRLHFQKDYLQCRDEADRLRFSFTKEDMLLLRQYITRKRNLYNKSGLKNKDKIIHQI